MKEKGRLDPGFKSSWSLQEGLEHAKVAETF